VCELGDKNEKIGDVRWFVKRMEYKLYNIKKRLSFYK